MSPAPRERLTRMQLPDDATPPAISAIDTVVGLARLEERMRAVSRRLDDSEERQDARDEMLRNQLTLAVQDAVETAIKRHVDPIAAEVRELRDAHMRSGSALRTIAKVATVVGAVASFLWGVASHIWAAKP